MDRKKQIESLIQNSFILHGGFYYTLHARERMIERDITLVDIESAYSNGAISKIEADTDLEIKVCWDGRDCDGELIRVVMVYLKEIKTLIITVIGDIYGD